MYFSFYRHSGISVPASMKQKVHMIFLKRNIADHQTSHYSWIKTYCSLPEKSRERVTQRERL